MNRNLILVLFIPIYFLAVLLITLNGWISYEEEAFQKLRLSIAIDRSTDAAAAEMIADGDLEMDYSEVRKMTVDPEEGFNTFTRMMLSNYGLAHTDVNTIHLQNSYIPVFLVTTYDGYYIYQCKKISGEGDYGMVSTPKLPYTYDTETATYSLNFGYEKALKFDKETAKVSTVTSPLSEAETLRVINTQVSDHLMVLADEAYAQGFLNTIYIPSEMTTISSTNAITGPTVLALVDGFNLTSLYKISDFSIGGTEVQEVRVIAGYIRNDTKYYAYADLIPSNVVVLEIFTSPLEAAQSGYYHDGLYMN